MNTQIHSVCKLFSLLIVSIVHFHAYIIYSMLHLTVFIYIFLQDYIHLMTPAEVQCYMRALFIALCNVHSHHVIHRDIKPSNFLYHRDSGRLCVFVCVCVRVC